MTDTDGDLRGVGRVGSGGGVRRGEPTVATEDAPKQVRIAGGVVGLEGLAGLAFAVALVVRGLTVTATPGVNPFGMAGYFAVLGAGVLASGIGLLLGHRWGRTPAVVMQLLLIGTAWYAIDGASRWAIGVPVAVVCVAVLVLLFAGPSRAWSLGTESSREQTADR